MSGIKDRLSRLRQQKPAEAQSAKPIDYEMNLEADAWAMPHARIFRNRFGQFVMRSKQYPLQHVHGKYALDELPQQADSLQPLVQDSTIPIKAKNLLFLDTETTGLGSGAGNMAFMVGIGYYSRDCFIVEQLFVRNPAEEPAMLHYFHERLTEFTHLVTYNGKSFDWPLIKNRFIMNRFPFRPDHLIHLDFLYPCRSIWRHTLESCKLGVVEEERLDVKRCGDLPGSLAPVLYFQYLATGDIQPLSGIFQHNELDILTLAGLAIHFSSLLQGRIDWQPLEPEELFRLGAWLDRLDETGLSSQIFHRLTSLPFAKNSAYLLPLAGLYKKRGAINEAVQLWQQYINCAQNQRFLSPLPFIELAIHYEHRQKQLDLAIQHAEKAKQVASNRLSLDRHSRELNDLCAELDIRIARLYRKQRNRQASKTSNRPKPQCESLVLF